VVAEVVLQITIVAPMGDCLSWLKWSALDPNCWEAHWGEVLSVCFLPFFLSQALAKF
jgi:hypothetical protein